MEDYEKTYEEFWKEIVENPDGSLNLDQVKRELHDFSCMMKEVPKVYDHVTGGLISKPNTKAEYVIDEANNLLRKHIDEEVEETLADVKEQVVWDVFGWIEEHLGSIELYIAGEVANNIDVLRKLYLEEMKKV